MATVPTTLTPAVGNKNTAANYATYVRDPNTFWLNTPTCRLYNSAAISAATSGTYVLLTWDTEEVDTDTMHDASTSRLIATTAGRYLVQGLASFAANAIGLRAVNIRKNAAGAIGGGTQLMTPVSNSVGASSATTVGFSFTILLAATDYLEAFAMQNSGGALNVSAGRYVTAFEMKWVGTS